MNSKLVRDFVSYFGRTYLFPIIESKQFLNKKEFSKRNKNVDYAIVNPIAIRVKFFEYASFFSAKTLAVLKHDNEDERPRWRHRAIEPDVGPLDPMPPKKKRAEKVFPGAAVDPHG